VDAVESRAGILRVTRRVAHLVQCRSILGWERTALGTFMVVCKGLDSARWPRGSCMGALIQVECFRHFSTVLYSVRNCRSDPYMYIMDSSDEELPPPSGVSVKGVWSRRRVAVKFFTETNLSYL
jgi:hypothetical protein